MSSRLILQEPEQERADAQVHELWRVAAQCEGIAQRAEMAAAGVKARAPDAKPWDQRAIIWQIERFESVAGIARAHARALRQAGNLHLVLSRPTPEVFA